MRGSEQKCNFAYCVCISTVSGPRRLKDMIRRTVSKTPQPVAARDGKSSAYSKSKKFLGVFEPLAFMNNPNSELPGLMADRRSGLLSHQFIFVKTSQ